MQHMTTQHKRRQHNTTQHNTTQRNTTHNTAHGNAVIGRHNREILLIVEPRDFIFTALKHHGTTCTTTRNDLSSDLTRMVKTAHSYQIKSAYELTHVDTTVIRWINLNDFKRRTMAHDARNHVQIEHTWWYELNHRKKMRTRIIHHHPRSNTSRRHAHEYH